MARRRLTAFDVSFPEERDDSAVGDAGMTNLPVAPTSASSLGKRKGDIVGDSRVSLFISIELAYIQTSLIAA